MVLKVGNKLIALISAINRSYGLYITRTEGQIVIAKAICNKFKQTLVLDENYSSCH